MNNRNLFLTAAFAMVSMAVFAQVEIPEVKPKVDSLQMAVDTLLLEGVTITAERPLYSVEGEKTLYQVSDDPTVQGGVASDALQNAPGVSVRCLAECARSERRCGRQHHLARDFFR